MSEVDSSVLQEVTENDLVLREQISLPNPVGISVSLSKRSFPIQQKITFRKDGSLIQPPARCSNRTQRFPANTHQEVLTKQGSQATLNSPSPHWASKRVKTGLSKTSVEKHKERVGKKEVKIKTEPAQVCAPSLSRLQEQVPSCKTTIIMLRRADRIKPNALDGLRHSVYFSNMVAERIMQGRKSRSKH